ncbi:MAG: hypothetical protein WBC51_18360 [Vicinamibacterales bacterium]
MWTALSLIVAAGVAYATLVLVRVQQLPRAARWSAALLGAYGTIAFLHGVLTGTPLPSLLAGQSFWRMLPYVLRGAVVGGLVVLPLALLVSLVRAGLRAPVPGSRARAIREAAALAVALAIVVAALPQGDGAGASVTRTATTSTPRAPIFPRLEDRRVALQNGLRALEEAQQNLRRDQWDPEYVVQEVGTEPERLSQWVRDNTSWIPYRGVLRGPIGVLMDRQGNSLDRSLLLATLLQKAGHSVRLAQYNLTEYAATEILPRLLAERVQAFDEPMEVQGDLAAEIDAATRRYQLQPAAIEQTLKTEMETVDRTMLLLDERVAGQTARLLSAVRVPDGSQEWTERLRFAMGALQEHWWIQWDDGTQWIDLDILEPDSRTSLAAPSPSKTVALNEAESLPRHEIALRVVSEHWSGGSLSERRVLEHVLRPAELLGQQVVLQFFPSELPSEQDPIKSETAFRERLLQQTTWGAALIVGTSVVQAATLRDGSDQPAQQKGGPFGALGGSAAAALDRSQPPAVFTAAWIEYEIRSPGRDPNVVRRAVFDLLGPAARATSPVPLVPPDHARRMSRSLALTTRTEILPIGFALAPEFLAHLAAQSVLNNRELLHRLARGGLPSQSELMLFERATPAPSPLYALALARIEWSGLGERTFIDRPNIFTRHRLLAMNGESIARIDATDIVSNEIGVSLTTDDAFAARLEQGVLDTNAEALLLKGDHVGGNTGGAFAVSSDWLTLTVGSKDAVDNLRLSEDARRAITRDLETGFDVVVPRAPVRDPSGEFTGWWRIDRRTGDTLGVAENGWGQAGERAVQYNVFVEMAKGFVFQEVFCRVAPLALEPARPFIQQAVYLWGPKWWVDTLPPPGDDKTAYEGGKAACLFGFMAHGVLATLPLVMMTLRFSSLGRLAMKLGPTFPKFRLPRRPPSRRPPSPRKPGKPTPPKPAEPKSPAGRPKAPPPECPDGAPKAPQSLKGPYRGDIGGRELLERHPDSDWLRKAGIKPQDLLDAFKKADKFAETAYNDAIKNGMSDASAHRVSQDAWHTTYEQVRPLGRRWDRQLGEWVWETRPPRAGETQGISAGNQSSGLEKGPYQADTVGMALLNEVPDSVAIALMGGEKTVNAIRKADAVAARYYQDMRAAGMSDVSAHQVSKDVWHDVFTRNRGNPFGRPVPPVPVPNQTMPNSVPGQCGPSPLAQSTPGYAAVNNALGK